MSASLDIQNAMTIARNQPMKPPAAGANASAVQKAAKEFESVFVAQFLGSMFEGIQTDGMFGGGQGEQMFRSMMLDQYGQKISEQGGFGIADSITRSLTDHQNAQTLARAKLAAKADGKTDSGTAPMLPTTKPDAVLAAHPAATAMIALPKKEQPVFAAHPATAFAASLAASAEPARSLAR